MDYTLRLPGGREASVWLISQYGQRRFGVSYTGPRPTRRVRIKSVALG